MWPVATDVARSVVCMSVLVTLINCEKTAELIEMLFRGRNHMSPGNRDLHGVEIPHWKGQFGGCPAH